MEEQIIYRLAKESDINDINSFYNLIYKKNRTFDQFVWEYNSAPAGKAIYVIAKVNDSIIGTQCAIPYYVTTQNNERILTAKSEDTLVSPNYRGRKVFENMYALLIEECIKNNISFIWGFTYASKPFHKIGFTVPYKSTMGLLTLNPLKAAKYFYSITAKKNFSSYCKILGLSFYSYCKCLLLLTSSVKNIEVDFYDVAYNNLKFNYLKTTNLFGLQLDKEFIDYRITRNPYNVNYRTINYRENGELKASVKFNITKDNIGYIIHIYFSNELEFEKRKTFLIKVIKESALKKTSAIRFWGFNHNIQNMEEIEFFKKTNFVFIPRGISFVGLNLQKNTSVDFTKFVLSRMASQGTD
jgi:hypothetical protein